MKFETSLYQVAKGFLGLSEIPGKESELFISWCLSLCKLAKPWLDETPWCSAFLVALCHILGLNCTYSAAARSWLTVGVPLDLPSASVGMDIIITSRPGAGPKAGHVGIFAGWEGDKPLLLAGNQGNKVSITAVNPESVLGVRRLQLIRV